MPPSSSYRAIALDVLLLSAAAGTAHAQWGSQSGTAVDTNGDTIKYYDKGDGDPANAASPPANVFSTTGNVFSALSSNTIVGCATYCAANTLSADLRGFSFTHNGDFCYCWTGSPEIASTINAGGYPDGDDGATPTPSPVPGGTFCFRCEDATVEPSSQPSSQPSKAPSSQPSGQPSAQPSGQPSGAPSAQPSGQPSAQPSRQPSSMPSEHPSSQPSSAPSAQPSAQPSEAPSANPSQGCENLRTDCGWGIFNPWTCRCDCPVGICLDNNEQCYHPCAETIHTNPWAGCSPGWDCPWYPDADVGHCASSLHQPNHFEIYRTAKECCDEHYKGSTTCVDESKAPWIYQLDRDTPFPDPNGHAPYPWPIHFPGNGEHRPDKPYVSEGTWGGHSGWGQELGNGPAWYPDLVNKLNCVYNDNYEDWMNDEGFAEEYLFVSRVYNDTDMNERDGGMEDCCEKWYPHLGDNCPDEDPFNPVNAEAEDEPWNSDPYSAHNYYFPDFSDNSCHFGRDYPAWMGWNRYEKYYLFREEDADLCCERFFPGQACPAESHLDADKPQQDYYWTSYQENLANSDQMPVKLNDTYWPDVNGGVCVKGTNFPSWMASDVDYIRKYLFKDLEGCCTEWFTQQNVDDCVANVRDTTTLPSNERFYPDLNGKTCVNGTDYPAWMTDETEYTEQYIFKTLEGCCVKWFGDENLNDCKGDVVQGTYLPMDYNATDVSNYASRWYPDLDGYECKKDGSMKSWMLDEDYREWYTFTSEEACCHAFGYC